MALPPFALNNRFTVWTHSLQVCVQEPDHTLPGERAGIRVVDIGALLVEETVLRLVAEQLMLYTGIFERRFERIDRLRRAPIVLKAWPFPRKWNIFMRRGEGKAFMDVSIVLAQP